MNKLPTPSGVASLRGPTDPLKERVNELMGLQEQIFRTRYKKASRRVYIVMKTLRFSLRFPIIIRFTTLYLKYVAFDR